MMIQELKTKILSNYLDDELLVSIVKNPPHWSSGNSLLHTGIFYTLLGINNAITQEDKDRFSKAVDSCWVTVNNKSIYGLLNRNKSRPDKEGHDDYIGVCAGAYFTNPRIAREVLSYGEENHFSYDNTSPYSFSLSTWHGRFPGLVSHYFLCSGNNPSLFQNISARIMFRYGSLSESSATILMWLRAQVAKRQGDKCLKQAALILEQRVKNTYGTIGNMFAPYFGSDHPFSRLAGIDGVLI